MKLDQAADLAARILIRIDAWESLDTGSPAMRAADRERVASDLEGLRDCQAFDDANMYVTSTMHAYRYAEGLRRTARLYGVEP